MAHSIFVTYIEGQRRGDSGESVLIESADNPKKYWAEVKRVGKWGDEEVWHVSTCDRAQPGVDYATQEEAVNWAIEHVGRIIE